MLARSPAIRKSSGAEKLDCTVWPTSTEREMTVPSMGAVIVA